MKFLTPSQLIPPSEIKPVYTSRSAITTYQVCPRKRYYNYLYDGTGIVPSGVNIHLVTGSAVHEGIASMLLGEGLKNSIHKALALYDTALDGRYLSGINSEYQEQVIEEHRYIIVGLIICFHRQQLQPTLETYNILTVEKDIGIKWGTDKYPVVFESKIDALIQNKQSGAVHAWSIKTAEKWDWWLLSQYKNNTQALLEAYGANRLLTRLRQENPRLPDKVYSTKFCFPIKGKRENFFETDFAGNKTKVGWETNTPIIKGWKQPNATGISYAHSNKIPKDSNISGWGYLPKTWEKFNVWEEQSLGNSPNNRILAWIKLLESGETIGYDDAPLKEIIVSPPEYIIDYDEVNSCVETCKNQEDYIRTLKERCEGTNNWLRCFPQWFDSCFNRGNRCEYYNICRGDDRKTNPLEAGFEKRVSHHKRERESHGN